MRVHHQSALNLIFDIFGILLNLLKNRQESQDLIDINYQLTISRNFVSLPALNTLSQDKKKT